MTISNIEVSLFLSESALSKYAIKHITIIFEKRLILACWVALIQKHSKSAENFVKLLQNHKTKSSLP